ncbi:MAG: hypothetical protein WBD40_08365, partial [Tepidisphaeraceae bacterium]
MMFNNHHHNTAREDNTTINARRRISKAVIETLETRQLMSTAGVVDGTLTITGNAHTSNYLAVRLMDDGATLEVKTNTKTKLFALADVDAIKITGSERTDVVRVDKRLTMPLDVRTFGGNDIVTTGAGADRAAHDGDVRYDAALQQNVALEAASVPRIVSFSLINADTDEVIAEYANLGDGLTLNLASLPTRNLNIRANVVGDQGGSVKFEFDGHTNIENIAHYTLAGNDGDNYFAWTPATGQFTLTANPYAHDKAQGAAGAGKTITLKIENRGSNSNPTPAPQP